MKHNPFPFCSTKLPDRLWNLTVQASWKWAHPSSCAFSWAKERFPLPGGNVDLTWEHVLNFPPSKTMQKYKEKGWVWWHPPVIPTHLRWERKTVQSLRPPQLYETLRGEEAEGGWGRDGDRGKRSVDLVYPSIQVGQAWVHKYGGSYLYPDHPSTWEDKENLWSSYPGRLGYIVRHYQEMSLLSLLLDARTAGMCDYTFYRTQGMEPRTLCMLGQLIEDCSVPSHAISLFRQGFSV